MTRPATLTVIASAAKQSRPAVPTIGAIATGLLRRFAPRNDGNVANTEVNTHADRAAFVKALKGVM